MIWSLRCLLLYGVFTLAFSVAAQQAEPGERQFQAYLVLDTGWPAYRHRFYPGDWFTFKLQDKNGWQKGHLQVIDKHSIWVLDAEIPLSEIRAIKVKPSGYWGQFGLRSSAAFMGNGLFIGVLGGLSELKNPGKGNYYLGLGGLCFSATGFCLRSLLVKTYRTRGKNTLHVIG